MELTILHLFPDFMSLYGEYANVAVLRRYLESLGVTAAVRAVCCEDTPDFLGADLIYMGAGTERKQKIAMEKLLPHAEELKAVAERGAVVLFTGNAMEVLGASVTDVRGRVWQGLGLADFTTVEYDRRDPGDVVAYSGLWKQAVVGFMNKCSITRGVTTPLFTEVKGFGNEESCEPEGCVSGNVFATHLTGPVLVKNPGFLGFITQRLFEQKGWECPAELPVLPHQREAHEVTLRELTARFGG